MCDCPNAPNLEIGGCGSVENGLSLQVKIERNLKNSTRYENLGKFSFEDESSSS